MYKELFKPENILNIDYKRKEFLKELEFRYNNDIPPGCKDKSKPDKGIGDLLIWKTVLEIGKKEKRDVIFVTGDEKNDWFYQSMNTPLYPRFELKDEFQKYSEGNTIHILNLSKLLDLYGAAKDIVEEIQVIEEDQQKFEEIKPEELKKVSLSIRRRRNIALARKMINEAGGVCQHCEEEYPFLEVSYNIPISQGGEDVPENIEVVCPNCHRLKEKRL